jgi:hypothetical protein
MPTPTPEPTFSQQDYEKGLVVYADSLVKPWSWSVEGEAQESDLAFEGEHAIAVSLTPGGAIYFDTKRPPYVPNYTWLVFDFNGGDTADQQLYLEMKTGFRTASGEIELGERVYLADYIEDYLLQPGQWYRMAIPLNRLDPGGDDFSWFEIGDASGDGASTFYIDGIRFVPAGP